MTKRRKKKAFITTTHRVTKWQKDLQIAVKKFKSQAKTVLAAAGFMWLVYELARALGGR
jgi:phosphoserine phosphatase